MVSITENLEMLDMIDSALKGFKTAYAEMKTKNKGKKKPKRKEESKKEEKEIQNNEDVP